MFCFLHRYKAIAVRHVIDTSYGLRCPSTNAVMQCQKCGKLKTKYLYDMGHRSIDEINRST
jgi:5-methylcytosine-specific restriction endonuclease McrA